jgi:hypothetical protein
MRETTIHGGLKNLTRSPMPIPSRPVALTRFEWNLADVPSEAGEIAPPFVLRPAGEQEAEDGLRVVESSYNLDPQWSGCAKHIDGTILPAIARLFEGPATCLFVLHGNRVIAASAYDPEPADGIHLVSGPCVFMEYRNRGIGGALLGATLLALRERGVTRAVGCARPGSSAAKYLCGKFGGREVVPAAPPAAPPTPEAAVAA